MRRFRQALDDLSAFSDAFDDFSQRHTLVDQDGRGNSVIHLSNAGAAREPRARLNRLAGPAQRAVDLADGLQSMPTIRTIEPQSWERLHGEPLAARDDIRSVVEQAQGTLEAEVASLERRSRGLAGLLAWLWSRPAEARELAGLSEKSLGGRALSATVVLVEFVIAVGAAIFAGWALWALGFAGS